MDYKKRCADCTCLVLKNKVWCCDECFGQPCAEIDDCPEGVNDDTIAELDELDKIKIDHGASADKPKAERKKPTKKISAEKINLFNSLLTSLTEIYGENVSILNENELVGVKINDIDFKINIIQTRKPKK